MNTYDHHLTRRVMFIVSYGAIFIVKILESLHMNG